MFPDRIRSAPAPRLRLTPFIEDVGDPRMQTSDFDRAPADASCSRGTTWSMPWPVVALVVVTVANYVWQVPYYEHFYGRHGHAPGGLTVPLVLTFVWFSLGTVLLVARRRGGLPVLASFLVVEALFYLVHNLSGAAGRDLPAHDTVLLVASVLGYLNALASVAFLVWLRRVRRADRAAGLARW